MKLTDNKIEPKCEYCVNGSECADSSAVLCRKKGIMRKDSSCRSFKYDILKREPRPRPVLPVYSKDEFEL